MMKYPDRVQENKAWCFDNNVSNKKVLSAWYSAEKTNHIVQNFVQNRLTPYELPNHLFKQLVERYPKEEGSQ